MNKKILKLIINGESYSLNSTKLLIGSAENADIKVSHNSISHYHSMIFVENNTAMVLDLESQNGTYINGTRIIAKSPLFEGDTLSLGKLNCDLLETNETVEFIAQDNNVQIYEELQSSKVYIPTATNENEILIDDEYCDIIFDDDHFIPLHKNPVLNLKVNNAEYIEPDGFEEAFNIIEENNGQCIQVTTSLNGNLLEQYYFPIQDGVIQASTKVSLMNKLIEF